MTTIPQENAAYVRGFLTNAVVGGDTDSIEAFIIEAVVDHDLVFGDGRERGPVAAVGRNGLVDTAVVIDVDDVVATADRVPERGTVAGSHRESSMDLPGPGNRSRSCRCGSAEPTTGDRRDLVAVRRPRAPAATRCCSPTAVIPSRTEQQEPTNNVRPDSLAN